MIKAIFFDMDGTLLSHSLGDVPPSARQCLTRLRQKGILCFMATGRHLLELDSFPLGDLAFDGYVTVNGQLVLDKQRTPLCATPFSPEATATLAAIFRENSFPLSLVEENRMYLNFVNDHVRKAQQAIETPIPELSSWQGAPIYHGSVFLTEGEEPRLRRLLGDSCRLTRWNAYAMDVIPKDGGKVYGMERLLDHFCLSRQEIMAFGDGENDREMLSYAAIGIAMGNAREETKAAADYVTDHIDRDGIEKALGHFDLL